MTASNLVTTVLKDQFFEVIVIGGGTCGLAILARLCEQCPASLYSEDEHQRFHWLKRRGNKVNLLNRNVSSKTNYKPETHFKSGQTCKPEDILVLDTVADNFLGQWDNQFATCQIPFLRSPMFFHCDPVNIDGLYSYAFQNQREDSRNLKEIKNVVGKEYSKHQLKKLIKKKLKKSPVPTTGNHDKPGIIDIDMRDYRDYYRPSTELFHDFCHEIVDRYNLHNVVKKDEVTSIEYVPLLVAETNETGKGFLIKTSSGKTYASKICIVASGHRGTINYPIQPFTDPHFPEGSCHTTHIFSGQVNFLQKELQLKKEKKTSVVIVGGGLTAAQLAHVAVKSGIDNVYLLLRNGIKIKHFDFHLDWVTKYRNVKQSAFYMKDTDQERWEMIQNAREGGSFNPEYYKIVMNHVKNGRLDLKTNCSIKNQSWNHELKTWNLKLELKKIDKSTNETKYTYHELDNVDYIYFATGVAADVPSLPFMKPIIESHKIDFVSGLPCLTDNLQWNNQIPLFMTGKNAFLRMGPVSANLAGARLGAERIGWWIEELRERNYFNWQPVCKYCSEESLELHNESLDLKLDCSDNESDDSGDSSYETQLKLACGQMNWFSLLSQE